MKLTMIDRESSISKFLIEISWDGIRLIFDEK